MFGSKNDFIVNVPTNEGYPEQRKCKSVWRWWNQLTKFQRSVAYMLVLVGFITVVYLFPANSNSPVLVDLEQNELAAMKRDYLVSSVQQAVVMEEPRESVAPAAVAVPVVSGGEHEALEQPQEAEAGEPAERPLQFTGPTNERQRAVVAAFEHAWRGYRQFAWGHDHLRPVSAQHHDWFGLGLTIIDSLDTMYIMGLGREFERARDWVRDKLTFDVNRDVNLFEVTIRVLGGLLGAYHLSGDVLFLQRAQDLADRLLPCFDSESGVPFSDVNLATRKAHSPKWSPDSSTSEVTTVQLEFRDLSRSVPPSWNSADYEHAAARVSEHVHGLHKQDGLVPIFINANTGQFRSYSTVTLGARGDSYYEYLLKQWLQTGKTLDYLRDDYLAAIKGVQERLARRTTGRQKLLFIGELLVGGKDFKPKMDHLTCYLPGTLALGVHNGLPRDHLRLAEDLLYTCYQTYVQQPTHLAPEISYFYISADSENEVDMYVKINDAHNLLRPELIESLWYMWQLTGNDTYQDWGWQIFQAFEKHTRVQNGYTSIGNVRAPDNTRPKDMMESFFLGETLKYLYLLFADDPKLLDLERWVINTEAHPLPIRAS